MFVKIIKEYLGAVAKRTAVPMKTKITLTTVMSPMSAEAPLDPGLQAKPAPGPGLYG
ncbi:MAG: hypothetical protein HPY61_04270 [Methanotrichaceae archaeon]|nr:hypothetical protein [Methanotrichaceae archaeon]